MADLSCPHLTDGEAEAQRGKGSLARAPRCLCDPTATPTLLPVPTPRAPGGAGSGYARPNSGTSVRGRHVLDSSDPRAEEGGALRTDAWDDGVLFGHKKDRGVETNCHADHLEGAGPSRKRRTQKVTSQRILLSAMTRVGPPRTDPEAEGSRLAARGGGRAGVGTGQYRLLWQGGERE